MEYFRSYFADVDFDTGAEEVKVLCPFHNDTRPSGSINTVKEVFKCWVCGTGYNEAQFMAKINGISVRDANILLAKSKDTKLANKIDWDLNEKALLWANSTFLEKVEELGLSRNLIEELNLGLVKDDLGRSLLGIPVFYNGMLVDVRKYNLLKLDGIPKVSSPPNSQMGYLIPYDIWTKSSEKTYIMEGEKDMLIARELGLNAVTVTGGASASINKYVINAFKGRDVVICYDNDEAGRNGAKRLYSQLRNIAASVRYINIGDVVEEDKEDFYDFVKKYNKDIIDFYSLVEYDFGENDLIVDKKYTTVNNALFENKLRRELVSKVTVSAEFDETYAVPQIVTLKKVEEFGGKNETLMLGETRTWTLDDENVYQALELIEIEAKKNQIYSKFKTFCGIHPKEEGIDISVKMYATVYRNKIIDADTKVVVDETDTTKNMSLELYSFQPLQIGKQYEITYTIYPHPTKHQKLVAIATVVVELDSTRNYKPNKQLLSKLQFTGTVEERLEKLYNSAKHHIAKHLNYNMWLMSDLVFNSILEFDYDTRIRGALDVFIIGDTQTGKSETTSKLTELYNSGHFLSLKTSTTVGLIGGSNKVDGSWLNTIGAIPRQHKKLVVMEEFSGAKPDFIKTMTEIRSSGNLKLARAAGELKVPCMLRMITLSNPINDKNGNPRHLSTFPNAIIPLMELINSAEDVARYDGFLTMPKPKTRFNPFAYKLEGEPIPKEVYEHKINWVYTRKPENVIFENDVKSYIWEKAQELNAKFECNFPLFGTTTPLKLARFCVALASLLTNTDSKYENVIVTKEIVDYMVKWLDSIYDNDVFKLKEYKDDYDSYSEINSDEEIKETEKLYSRNSTLFDFLETVQTTSRSNLRSISGLKDDTFSLVFNKLVRLKLLRIVGENVYPTTKFRKILPLIDRTLTHDNNDTMVKIVRDK